MAQPLRNAVVVAIATLIAVALILYLGLGSMTKKARVTGIVVPVGGTITIAAPVSGTIVNRHVVEGQVVNAGDVLFELSTERQGSAGETSSLVGQQLALRLQSLETERRTRSAQDSEKSRALELRLVNFSREMRQLQQEIGLTRRRKELAQKSLEKYQTLEASGFVSAAQSQQKHEELIDFSVRLSSLERGKVQQEANKIALETDLLMLKAELSNTLAQLDRAQSALRQEIVENLGRRIAIVKAHRTGTLTTIMNEQGQSVSAGQALATLVPLSAISRESVQLEVHLYAASRMSGFLMAGQKVLIRYQAFPYQKFGLYAGTIIDVSGTPFAPGELPASVASTILSNAQQSLIGSNSSEGLFRIKVRLEKQSVKAHGREHVLRPGMTVEADVLQDRRKLWEWILEPAFSVAHRS